MASNIVIPITYAIVVLFASYGGAEGSIGINWGRESAQRLVPSQVVDLLLQNGIGRARIYSGQPDLLDAFAGTGINLTVTISNPKSIRSMEKAREWVQAKHEFFSRSNIRSVYFGRYIFDHVRVDKALIASSLKALRWLQEALNERGFDYVQANFVNYEGIFKPNITKPSEAEFPDEYKLEVTEYLRFLQENDAPFPMDSIPLTDNAFQNFDMSFAFPDRASNFVIKDINGAVYTNAFEWRFDCYVWAMRKLNFTNIKIVVSQVGWPTDGFPGATISSWLTLASSGVKSSSFFSTNSSVVSPSLGL